MKLKFYNPNELAKNIKAAQTGKINYEKNENIRKSIMNIEFMYNELNNNYLLKQGK